MAVFRNLAVNPQPKLSADGWTRSGGTSAWTALTSGFDGDDAFMEMEFTAVPGTVTGSVSYEHTLGEETLVSATMQLISSREQVFTPLVTFFDAADAVIEVFYASEVAVGPASPVTVGVAGMAVPPAAEHFLLTAAVSLEDGVPPQVGDTISASRAMISPSLAVLDYRDGSYPNWAWDGTEWASASEGVLSTAPTLVPLPDWSPVPRVSVIFETLHPSAASVTVQRVVGGRVHNVRGAIAKSVFGGFGVLDMEAPKDVTVTYRAAQFDTEGVFIEYTDSASTLYTFEGSCIHQPLDPNRNVRYRFREGAVDDILRPHSGDLFYPEGRSIPLWISTGPRRGITGVNLNGYTLTLDDATAIESLFGTPGEVADLQMPILCIRTSDLDLPPTFFALVAEPHRRGFDRNRGGEAILWDMSGTEVAPPAEGLVVPPLTYDDLDAAYATYDERDAAYASYLEQDTDWSLAGTADA